jgi:hypothetical protein
MAIIVPVATKFDDTGLRKAQKKFGGFGKSLKGLLGGAAIAAGFAAVTGAITSSVKAAAADAKSQKILALQLRNSTKATKAQIAAVEEYLGKLSMQVGIQDDELRPSFANLVRQVPDVNKAQKMFALALDASASSGKPLGTVINALGKYYNGNKTALIRLFPELKKSSDAMGDLAKSTKGAAEASADPFAKFNVAVGELSEEFGQKLLPYVIEFVNYLTETVVPAVSGFLEDMANPNTDTGKAFLMIKEAMVGKDGKSGVYGSVVLLVQAIGNLFGTLSTNGNALDGLVKAMEILSITLDVILYNIASIINQPLSGFADRVKKQIYGAAAIAAVIGRESLFSNGWKGQAAPNQTGLSPRAIEGNFANGGVVMPRVGGTIARIGEAGQPEAVIPLDRWKSMTGGGKGGSTYNITIVGGNANLGQTVVDAIKGYERTNGSGWRS